MRPTAATPGGRGNVPSVPGGSGRPPAGGPAPRSGGKRRSKGRIVALVAIAALLFMLAWPIGLLIWANGKITHVEALSGAAATPGTTFLLAGSDARGSGGIDDETTGARTDTILVLHRPESGPAALISIPRDSRVEIPGRGVERINAAYAFGGPQLLVRTVEHLTGLTVDHYVEIGFGGIADVVDAIGGVELCSDLNVNDAMSGMVWTPGCHEVDGTAAIAFSRMRYSDPLGDIGRTDRQRQLIGAVTSEVATPDLLLNPGAQVSVLGAGLGAISASEGTNVIDFGRLALTFRAATGPDGITGTPPLGAHWQLDAAQGPAFWEAIRNGTLPPGTVGGL